MCAGKKPLQCLNGEITALVMDSSLLEDLIEHNKPFQVETASGRVFDILHRDFVSFSRKKTSLIISYDENGEDHVEIVPLLTITSTMAKA